MKKAWSEFKDGWTEVAWIRSFSTMLLLTTSVAVLAAYAIEKQFPKRPSVLQILLAAAATAVSAYVARKRFRPGEIRFPGFPKLLRGSRAPKPVEPPPISVYLLLLILPKSGREIIIGDLLEDYAEARARYGRKIAKLRLYKQIASTSFPILRGTVLRLVSKPAVLIRSLFFKGD